MINLPLTFCGSPLGRSRAQALQLEASRRLRGYQEYLDFYSGAHYRTNRRGRTNLVVNYARTIVDKGVSFLMGRGMGFAVEPLAARVTGLAGIPRITTVAENERARAAAAEAYLYDVYDDNDLEAVDLACAVNAAVLGDGVYKVYWDAALGQVRVVSFDPLGFFPVWRADDLGELVRVDCCWAVSLEQAEDLYGVPAGAGASTRQVEVVETWTRQSYGLEVDGKRIRGGPNPYGVIPFIHVPNLPEPNQFWGRSDLVDVIPLNRELNERVSDQADVIRYHADPPVVFRGVDSHDSLTVGPGTVWDIPADGEVKLLEWQGQPVAVQEHIGTIQRMLYETSETPRSAFGDSGRLLSGVALETEIRPLIQRTLRKRVIWSARLRQRTRLIWQIAEAVGAVAPGTFASLRPRVIWPSMMPTDDAAEVNNNVRLVSAGLRSRATAMDLLGTESPEQELARVEDELRRIGPVQQVSGLQGGS